jgi:hypothetical protein
MTRHKSKRIPKKKAPPKKGLPPKKKPVKAPTKATLKKAEPEKQARKGGRSPHVTWHGRFIDMLGEMANVRLAAQAARINRATAYKHRDLYPEFKKKWDEAIDEACDRLEAAAWDRAQNGVKREIMAKVKDAEGKESFVAISEETRYSDVLLIFLLKAHRPSKFRERHEITGLDEGPIELDVKFERDLDRVFDEVVKSKVEQSNES